MNEFFKLSTHCIWHFIGIYSILATLLFFGVNGFLRFVALLVCGFGKNLTPESCKSIKQIVEGES